jgi:hypothetical protein
VVAVPDERGVAAVHRHDNAGAGAGAPQRAEAGRDMDDVAERGELDDKNTPQGGQRRIAAPLRNRSVILRLRVDDYRPRQLTALWPRCASGRAVSRR